MFDDIIRVTPRLRDDSSDLSLYFFYSITVSWGEEQKLLNEDPTQIHKMQTLP